MLFSRSCEGRTFLVEFVSRQVASCAGKMTVSFIMSGCSRRLMPAMRRCFSHLRCWVLRSSCAVLVWSIIVVGLDSVGSTFTLHQQRDAHESSGSHWWLVSPTVLDIFSLEWCHMVCFSLILCVYRQPSSCRKHSHNISWEEYQFYIIAPVTVLVPSSLFKVSTSCLFTI